MIPHMLGKPFHLSVFTNDTYPISLLPFNYIQPCQVLNYFLWSLLSINVSCSETCTPTEEGMQLAKCTVPSIKSKSADFRKRETTILSLDESEETKKLSLAQLERLVLLDQLKVSRMQLEEFRDKKEQLKKENKISSEIFQQERDCIAV